MTKNATLELPQEVKNQLNGSVELSVDTLDDGAKETGEWEGYYIDCVVTFEDEKSDQK